MEEIKIELVFTGIDLKLAHRLYEIFCDIIATLGGKVGGSCMPYVDEEDVDGED
jgi:hypothetical protein